MLSKARHWERDRVHRGAPVVGAQAHRDARSDEPTDRVFCVSSDVATALGAAFVASILTITGSLLVARYQARRAADQGRLADQRLLRDAKRERLRRDYEDVAFAADTIRGAANELSALFRGDTVDERNERINRRLADATEELARPILRLRLEVGTEPIIEHYQALRAAWFEYTDYWLPRLEGKDRVYGEIATVLGRISASVSAILDKAKADLDALSRPI
jgi:hypothetical protein